MKQGKFHTAGLSTDGRKIDEVLLLPFKTPHSYTGEDVIEIHCHGGINVVRNILEVVLKNGARMAERGEFTKRAFLNKKMDLSQAEAVCGLNPTPKQEILQNNLPKTFQEFSALKLKK